MKREPGNYSPMSVQVVLQHRGRTGAFWGWLLQLGQLQRLWQPHPAHELSAQRLIDGRRRSIG